MIRRPYVEGPTIFLAELKVDLAERGVATSETGLCRFFKRYDVTRTPPSKTLPT